LPPPLINNGKTITLPGLKWFASCSAPCPKSGHGKGGLGGKPHPLSAPSPSSASAGAASHSPGSKTARKQAHFRIKFIGAPSQFRPLFVVWWRLARAFGAKI